MALINCPECGNQVSDKASSCPKCGHPISAVQNEVEKSAEPKPSLEKTVKPQSGKTQQPQTIKKSALNQPIKMSAKTIRILVLSTIGVIVVVFAFMFFRSQAEKRRQAEEFKQREIAQRQIQEQMRKQEEERIRQANAEEEKRMYSYRQIAVDHWEGRWNWLGTEWKLETIRLYNPTNYEFSTVYYQFVDKDDGAILIDDVVGPLLPFQRQTFAVNQKVKISSEHKHEVRIIGSNFYYPGPEDHEH
jgi:hypothetical protein